jgi:3-methyladenine DNA glycosylase AlkD
VLAHLKRISKQSFRDSMARYGIPSAKAVGVPVGVMRAYAKQIGTNHRLALELWASGSADARMLATMIGDPAAVTPSEMESWAGDFDSWAICDTACFGFWDRAPHTWSMIPKWAERKEEFVRRAAFSLLACLTVHDKKAGDSGYLAGLELIERFATDERNFVKKAVNWALRSIGKRNAALNDAAREVAKRLSDSSNATARWVGKDALRELASPSVANRLAKKMRASRD